MRDKIVLLTQFLLMIANIFAPLVQPGVFDFSLVPFAWHKSIGFILNLLGFAIVVKAKLDMKKSFKISPSPALNQPLVTDGIFSYSRNPIYVGGLMMCFGWGISFGSYLGVFISTLLTLLLRYKIFLEETYLLKKYSESYFNYKKKAPRFLF